MYMKNLCQLIAVIVGSLTMITILGGWALVCQGIAYGNWIDYSNERTDQMALHVSMGWISVTVTQLAASLGFLLTACPLLGVTRVRPFQTNCFLVSAALVILSGLYFAHVWTEVFIQQPVSTPNLWSMDSTRSALPYFLSGWLKTLPGFSILGYVMWTDGKSEWRKSRQIMMS